ncbi:MAG: TIGR01777 family oxidoreductase [Vicinamibacterales bacterium]
MRIVIAGGTGFLGRALSTQLQARGDDVRVLTRRPTAANHIAWNPAEPRATWTNELGRADAVVNLAGEPIDKGRWTEERKAVLVDSRVTSTRSIVSVLKERENGAVLLNASAVGYYGACGDEVITEMSLAGHGFLASLCRKWEAEASKASERGRVVLLRTGLVLDARAGALARLLLPFKLGLGGPMGDGRQFWPWIHRDDWVRLVMFAIDDARFRGPTNLSAPEPVTNAVFAQTLGRVLHRPAIMPAPRFALSFVLGEMAEAMVLSGQRAIPARAQSTGFTFAHPDLEAALKDLLTRA